MQHRKKHRPSTAPSKASRSPMLPSGSAQSPPSHASLERLSSNSTPPPTNPVSPIVSVPLTPAGASARGGVLHSSFSSNSDLNKEFQKTVVDGILVPDDLSRRQSGSVQTTADVPNSSSGRSTSPSSRVLPGSEWPHHPSPGDADALDWPVFMRAYASGLWDPYKTPNPPRPAIFSPRYGPDIDWKYLQPFLAVEPSPPQRHSSSSNETFVTAEDSPLMEGDSMGNAGSPPSTSTSVSPPLSLPYPIVDTEGVTVLPRRSVSPNASVVSLARRRGTDPPDLRTPSIHVLQATPPVQTNASKLSVRPPLSSSSSDPLSSPFGQPSGAILPTPQLPGAYNPENATVAATMRWAGAGVTVAPLSLPSPEYELTDPMRKINLGSSNGASGSTRSLERGDRSRERERHSLSSSAPSPRMFAAARSIPYSSSPRLEAITGSPQGSPLEHPSSGAGLISPSSPHGKQSPETLRGQSEHVGFVEYSRPGQTFAGLLNHSISAPMSSSRRASAGGDYFGDAASQVHRPSLSMHPSDNSSTATNHSSTPSGIRPRTPDPIRSSESTLLPSTGWNTHLRSQSSGSTASVGLSSRHSSANALCGPTGGLDVVAIAQDPPQDNTSIINGVRMSRLGPTNIPVYESAELSYAKLGWLKAPYAPDEVERRKALYRFNVLYSNKDVNFERIAHLVKLVFNTKMVLISLVDEKNQWHKAEAGVNAQLVDRTISFCSHTVLQRGPEPMVILDATKDWRFMGNPLVKGPPGLRFYAGAPLRTQDGHNVGSLCILDDQPRAELSPRSRHSLKEFAAIVMRELELWRDRIQLRIRDRIQTSMEQFTRECLGMQAPEPTKSANDLHAVCQKAANLVKETLDVEGALVLDVSHFETVETVDPDGNSSIVYHGDLFEGERGQEFGPIPDLPIMGSAEESPPSTRGLMLSGEKHAQISKFLGSYTNGNIYERLPTCFRHLVPQDISYAMIVPIFDTDKIPFALLLVYTSKTSMHFLEGYELQYLRAIGVIILSAVLKRRMYLADNSKALFISNISHELRTPLHGILASAELLETTRLTATQMSYLQTVQACGSSLVETVNHVLDFTKLSGSSKRDATRSESAVKFTAFDLAQLVDDVVEGCWIGVLARADYGRDGIGSVYNPPSQTSSHSNGLHLLKSHVEPVVDIVKREQGWMIKTDRGGLRRALMNIIGNSIKFTDDGYVHISLREVPGEYDPHKVRLELLVVDTGKGISADFIQNRLFQPFSQENPLQTGTGLGLAIVNTIIKSLHGTVNVTSTEGQGTEMRITLEVEAIPPSPKRAQSREEQAQTTMSSPIFGSSRTYSISMLNFDTQARGVLLLRKTLHRYLTDWWGFTTLHGEEPLGDIILIHEDFDFIKELAAQKVTHRPVVLLSSARGDAQMMAAVSSFEKMGGMCRIVFKPCGPTRTKEALRAAIRMLESPRGRPSSPETSMTYGSRPRVQPGESTVGLGMGSDDLNRDSDSYSYYDGASLPPSPRLGAEWRSNSGQHLSSMGSPAMLTRRRSEETHDSRVLQRPSMMPRSSTYHSTNLRDEQESALTEMASSSEDLTVPSSPGSTYSLADGSGSMMLKSAAGSMDVEANKPSVLLVDDNRVNRNLLAQWLRKKGYSYSEAVDGQEAVEIFEKYPQGHFDVLLLDLSMPRLDGFEAGAAIRKIEARRRRDSASSEHARSKIFALTGLASADDKRRAFAVGVDGYLVKPVSFKTLDNVFSRLTQAKP